MKIVIAVDSFKGSLTSKDAVKCIDKGIKKIIPDAETICIPVADGGEGTKDAFVYALGGKNISVKTHDPLGREITSDYAILPDGTAVIEIAQASGLTLLKENELNPYCASTYGTGELIRDALNNGCRRFIIGLGGSATNDGGAGILEALGVRFLDKSRMPILRGCAGLAQLVTIDDTSIDQRISESIFLIASDVKNVLCGENGATAIFGKQKGVAEDDIPILDGALSNYAKVLQNKTGNNLAEIPGSGAAGGAGVGLMAFCRAEFYSGIDLLLDTVRFENYIQNADIVITGEGRIDGQSVFGKVPCGIAKRTKAFSNIPVVAIVGSIGPGVETVYKLGVDYIIPISSGKISIEESMENAHSLLTQTAEKFARSLPIKKQRTSERL